MALLQPLFYGEYKAAKYEIIAGERRFRAMELLGWEAAPAIVEKDERQGVRFLGAD